MRMVAAVLFMLSGVVVPRYDMLAETTPQALVERAIRRMGGLAALRGIERVRYDLITQWHSIGFEDLPFGAGSGYELHTDVRDYTIDAWRNTRRFVGRGDQSIVDLVRGHVAVRDFGNGFEPLNIAYVDERDELFAYTPDRLVLAAARAADLQAGPDTVIAGLPHARVHYRAGRLPLTVFFRRSDDLPVMVRYRAAAPNDFGLVPWGEMEVEVWYSAWSATPDGLALPRQLDVFRVGQPYKRITVLGAAVNPTFEADSFAVSEELRAAYRRDAIRPMHDLPLDSSRVTSDGFVDFRTFGAPRGVVRVGGEWVLLETGQAPLSLTRAMDWMAANLPGPTAFAIAGSVGTGNGGVAVAAERDLPVYVGSGALPFVRRVLRNHGRSEAGIRVPMADAWLRVGTDSLRVERLDLPNARGSIIAWAPSLRWVWAPDAASALDLQLIRERVEAEGWPAEWLGSRRGLRAPLAP